MTRHLSIPLALVALCCSGPVVASPAQQSAPPAEVQNSGSEMVCRVEKVPGSRFASRRVCLTRDQWRMQRRAQREDVEHAQRIKYR